MKVNNVVTGWYGSADRSKGDGTTMQIVDFNLPNDAKRYFGHVILSRYDGSLVNIFVRAGDVGTNYTLKGEAVPTLNNVDEGIAVSAEIQKQIERAARKGAGTLVPSIQ